MSKKNVEGLWIITDIYDGDKRGKIRTATTTRGKDSAIRAALRFAERVEIEYYDVEHVRSYDKRWDKQRDE